MSTFQLTAAVYVVVNPQWKPGHPESPKSSYGLQTAFTETGLPLVPVFTDDDLAERWMKQQGVIGLKLNRLAVPQEYAAFLEGLRKTVIGHVGYDPGGTYRVFTIEQVLYDLRQQETDEKNKGGRI